MTYFEWYLQTGSFLLLPLHHTLLSLPVLRHRYQEDMVVDKLVLCCMLIPTVSEHPPLLFSKVTDTSGCSTKLVKNHRFC